MKYWLIIKAPTSTKARQAAEDRGIHLETAYHGTPGEVEATTKAPIEQLQRWFNESVGCSALVPAGTLLLFRELRF